MNQVSRRTVIGGIAAMPFASIGLGRVFAQDESTPDSTPIGSPEATPGASLSVGNDEVIVMAIDIAFE